MLLRSGSPVALLALCILALVLPGCVRYEAVGDKIATTVDPYQQQTNLLLTAVKQAQG